MLQVPTLPNYQLPQPSYNAVKIDIHNPSVGGGATCPVQPVPMMPQPMMQQPVVQQPQYTAPIYAYPQAVPAYNYPQAAQQPYYMPVQQNDILTQAQAAQAAAQAQAAAMAAAQAQAMAQAATCQPCAPCAPVAAPQVSAAAAAATAAAPIQQVNINQAPAAPAPVVTKPDANAEANVEVQQPAQTVTQQVDLNNFIARLTNPDFEIQASAMEDIANMVKDEPQKATELLDAKVMDSLINIMNADSGKLAGPTQEQIAARQKLMSGQQISEEDKTMATTITPMEQAERNKSYAMYTSAILQKLYKEEVAKLTGATVPLTELPAAMTVVDNLKDNPNPMVRTAAIEAMSYVQAPEYKKDLTTLFSVALNDQDKGVQEAAKAALAKLDQV